MGDLERLHAEQSSAERVYETCTDAGTGRMAGKEIVVVLVPIVVMMDGATSWNQWELKIAKTREKEG